MRESRCDGLQDGAEGAGVRREAGGVDDGAHLRLALSGPHRVPFRKAWRRLVMADGRPDRRLYETAVLATLRDRLRSGDVWVEPSSPPSRLTEGVAKTWGT